MWFSLGGGGVGRSAVRPGEIRSVIHMTEIRCQVRASPISLSVEAAIVDLLESYAGGCPSPSRAERHSLNLGLYEIRPRLYRYHASSGSLAVLKAVKVVDQIFRNVAMLLYLCSNNKPLLNSFR